MEEWAKEGDVIQVVFLVVDADWDFYNIHGAYTSRVDADNHCERLKNKLKPYGSHEVFVEAIPLNPKEAE